jgi:hypothetical protein
VRVRPGWALAVVIALAAIPVIPDTVAVASSSCPPSSATIVVDLPDGSGQTVTATDICNDADVFNTQYFTRANTTGGPSEDTQSAPFVQQGLSVRALLLTLGIDPRTVDFVGITRQDGTLSTLDESSHDLDDPPDFQGGLLPVVWVDGNVIDYTRPLRSDTDLNAADAVQTAPGGVLTVVVHDGPQLTVNATASRSSVAINKPVRFFASAPGASAASQPLSYTWTFGDGTSATGSQVSHAFTTAGGYDAQVTATGANDSAGVSPQVAITVGTRVHKSPDGGRGSGTKRGHKAPSTGPTTGKGHRTGSTPAKQASPGKTAVTKLPPSTKITIPAPMPPGAAKTGPADGVAPEIAQPPLISGQLIGPGTLLADTTAQANPATAPAARIGGAAGLPVALGAAAVVGLLLGAGAARELGWTRRRRRAVTP